MRVSELVNDLQALRAVLADELLSINSAEPLIDQLAHDDARAVVKELVDAHKHHVARVQRVIETLDPKQAEAARAAAAATGA